METYADNIKIKKVIENMLSYTINTSLRNSTIDINLSQNKNGIKFEIISKGFSENSCEIIQIFKQNQEYDAKYVELFIAKEIIKAHFGKIIYKNFEDNTNILGFCLPVR